MERELPRKIGIKASLKRLEGPLNKGGINYTEPGKLSLPLNDSGGMGRPLNKCQAIDEFGEKTTQSVTKITEK